MRESLTAPLDSLLVTALRVVCQGQSRANHCSGMALMCEYDVPPVSAFCAAARARLLAKGPGLRTFLRWLLEHKFSSRKRTWISATSQWLKRYKLSMGSIDPTLSHETRVLKFRLEVRNHVWQRMGEKAERGTLSFRNYSGSKFDATSAFVRMTGRVPRLARGTSWVSRLRLGAVWTAQKAAQAKLVAPIFSKVCPCCGEAEPETISHILASCPAWEIERAELDVCLASILGSETLGLLSPSEKATFLLGGAISLDGEEVACGTYRTWPADFRADQMTWVSVAQFMETILARRTACVWASAKSPTHVV
jgi:hypothetical protein